MQYAIARYSKSRSRWVQSPFRYDTLADAKIAANQHKANHKGDWSYGPAK